MRFYTTLKLGPNREVTKDGFTIFRNVCVSRVGEQIYGPAEVEGIEPGEDGLIRIQRSPEEVFRRESMDSCNGKPLVIDHPIDDVSPDNWQHLSHGMMFNARQGIGEQTGHVVTDIMVCTTAALNDIDNETREVSLGYDAGTFRTGVGTGDQRNIFVNHVALVPAGRCGGSCAIRDHKYANGECHMKKTLKDRISDAFKTKDEEGMKKALEEVKDEEHEYSKDCDCKDCKSNRDKKARDAEKEEESEKRAKKMEDSLKAIHDWMKARDAEKEEEKEKEKAKDEKSEEEKKEKKTEDDEGELEEEAPEGTGDKARKARDSAYLVDSFENVKMLAEIIAPGVKIPPFDKAADPNKMFRDCVCALRRKALQMATSDSETAALIEQVRGRTTDGAAFETMPSGQVRSIFNSVGALKKALNNAAVTRDSGGVKNRDITQLSPEERFAAASKARWAKR